MTNRKLTPVFRRAVDRRQVLGGLTAAGVAASTGFGTGSAFAQSGKTGVVRVWGEPGPYGGCSVSAITNGAEDARAGLKFEIEGTFHGRSLHEADDGPAAKRPPSLISVGPHAMQLMAEGSAEPADDLVEKIGRDRLVDG